MKQKHNCPSRPQPKSEVFFFFFLQMRIDQHYCSFFPPLHLLFLVILQAPPIACQQLNSAQTQDPNLATTSSHLCTWPPLVSTNPKAYYHCILKPENVQRSQPCWTCIPRSLPSLQGSQREGKRAPTSVFCSEKSTPWWKWPGLLNFRSWVPSHGFFLRSWMTPPAWPRWN